jgi:hypothetical protein
MEWDLIVGLILLIIALISAIGIGCIKAGYLSKNQEEIVRKILLWLTIEAEETLGAGTGKYKLAMVLTQAYKALPPFISWLISEKALIGLIESVLDDMRLFLEDHGLVEL